MRRIRNCPRNCKRRVTSILTTECNGIWEGSRKLRPVSQETCHQRCICAVRNFNPGGESGQETMMVLRLNSLRMTYLCCAPRYRGGRHDTQNSQNNSLHIVPT